MLILWITPAISPANARSPECDKMLKDINDLIGELNNLEAGLAGLGAERDRLGAERDRLNLERGDDDLAGENAGGSDADVGHIGRGAQIAWRNQEAQRRYEEAQRRYEEAQRRYEEAQRRAQALRDRIEDMLKNWAKCMLNESEPLEIDYPAFLEDQGKAALACPSC